MSEFSQEKSVLRLHYELHRGSNISNRTWHRIRTDLGINDEEDPCHESLVNIRTYARLRRLSPRGVINFDLVEQAKQLGSLMTGQQCGKREILEAMFSTYDDYPSDRTLRRWGDEIGAPFHAEIVYTTDQAIAWCLRLISARSKYTQQET